MVTSKHTPPGPVRGIYDSVEETSVDKAAKTFLGLKLFDRPGEEEPETSEKETPETKEPEPKPEEKAEEKEPEATEADKTQESDSKVESESSDKEEPESEPTEKPRSRKLRLPDGNEEEVSEDEAYLGYLRQADYTRKTQALAEDRKSTQAELESARKARAEYGSHLEQVKLALDALGKEPNWAELRKTATPETFAATVADWQTISQNRKLISDEQEKVAKATEADAKQEYEARVARERDALLKLRPEWADVAKAKEAGAKLFSWLKSKGWQENQIINIDDHRLILSLHDAMSWEELQAQKPAAKQQVKSKIKTAVPGTPGSTRSPSERQRDFARLQKTGKTDDAAKAFEHFIE